ncbi:hypothetical protein VTO42DRAFT_5175 [Malbranchea cinnamomea]
MQFTKTVVAIVLAVATVTMAFPANPPAGIPLEELERHQLQTRGGTTCKLPGGALICAGKCYAMGKAGGYCAKNDICTCY